MKNKKTILVTGATGNIGKGVALSLARRGARVVLLGRKKETLESGANLIRSTLSAEKIAFIESDIQTVAIDFTDFDSVKKTAQDVLIKFPEINGLVLSVGFMVQKGPNILTNGHELMFATSVLGPFLFTQLLIDRLQQSNGLVIQVIAPFYKKIDWNDIESIHNHKTIDAYNRAKTCERVIAAELARRYSGKLSSIAFNPSFIIDRKDPELKKRWPKGIQGLIWWIFALIGSRPPSVAGEPLADIILSHPDTEMNGALFKLKKRITPDKVMRDEKFGKKLWDEIMVMTGIREKNEKRYKKQDYKIDFYRVGIAATAFMLFMIPVQIMFYLIWPHPTTIVGWYELFQDNWFVGLVSFDFLYLLSMIASIFLYLALFFALNDGNKSLSIFALTIGLIGLALYFPSNTSIEMLMNSRQYAQAVSEQEKVILLASGQTFYSIWKGTSYSVYYVFNGIALILFFSAMIKDNKFRKSTAYIGLVSGVLMTVPATAGMIGMTIALVSLIPWSIFSILVIKDFRNLINGEI